MSLGSQYLFKILQTTLTIKISENVVKSGCFEKPLRWRMSKFLPNKEGIESILCKIIDILLSYW